VLQEEQDCNCNQDYRADDYDCEKEVSLFEQGCTVVTSDLLLLQYLNAFVESDNVSCCFSLFYTLHRRVVVCVKEASLMR
jgi:hypothetical protein